MELGLLLLSSLQRDVTPDFPFATLPAHRPDAEHVRPVLPAAKVLLRGGEPAERYHRDDLGRTLRRDRLQQLTTDNVVPVRADFQERHLVPRRNV